MTKTIKFYVEGIRGVEDGFDPTSPHGHTQKETTYDGYYDFEVSYRDIADKLFNEHNPNKEDLTGYCKAVDLIEALLENDVIDLDNLADWLHKTFREDAEEEARNGN